MSLQINSKKFAKEENEYIDNLEPIFITLRECENGRNIDDILEGPACHVGFKRLN